MIGGLIILLIRYFSRLKSPAKWVKIVLS